MTRSPLDMGGAFAGVPLCSRERCASFSGKRCNETGNEPGEVCVPEVRAMNVERHQLRALLDETLDMLENVDAHDIYRDDIARIAKAGGVE